MISIITVCHKSSALMSDYVGSFIHYNMEIAHKREIEFIFVENSGDFETEVFAKKLRDHGFIARVIDMENRGFGAGCNAGAKIAQGELLAFANPDIRFVSSGIAEMQGRISKYSWGTVCQLNDRSRVYSFDLLPEYRSIITEGLRVHRYMHSAKRFRKYLYPVGSFFFVHKNLFEDAGGFNERFFLYYEEAELSRRLYRISGEALYLENPVIWHKGLGTQPDSTFSLREEARGFIMYCLVTQQEHLVSNRIATMRKLSVVSKTASIRAKLIETAWQERNVL